MRESQTPKDVKVYNIWLPPSEGILRSIAPQRSMWNHFL